MPRELDHPDVNGVSLETILSALADPVRLGIVRMAADSAEPLPCKSFTDAIPKSTASHHWKVLREGGLIYQEPMGTSLLNSLRRDEIDARFPGLLDAVLTAE